MYACHGVSNSSYRAFGSNPPSLEGREPLQCLRSHAVSYKNKSISLDYVLHAVSRSYSYILQNSKLLKVSIFVWVVLGSISSPDCFMRLITICSTVIDTCRRLDELCAIFVILVNVTVGSTVKHFGGFQVEYRRCQYVPCSFMCVPCACHSVCHAMPVRTR